MNDYTEQFEKINPEPDNSADPSFVESDAQLIANGYEPVVTIGKRPVAEGWQAGDMTPERLATEREAHPDATNTGLRTGHLVGVDLDIIPPDHVEAIKTLALDLLGCTTMERVGAKGAMLCYRNETPIRKVTISGKHPTHPAKVEILGSGQQLVAYGVHPDTGKPFLWPNTELDAEPLLRPLAELTEVTPDKLRDFAGRAATLLMELGYTETALSGATGERPHMAASEGIELDTPANRERATLRLRQLVERGDVAREGEGGDDRTYKLAAEIINLGMSDQGALDLISSFWNAHCKPPWSDDELETLVGNAWRYKQNEAGSWGITEGIPGAWRLYAAANPPAEPEPPEADAPSIGDRPRRKASIITGSNVVPTSIEWLWNGYLARGKFHILGGQKGCGKSTLTFSLFATLTTGGRWPDGLQAPTGDVLIWSSEDDFSDTILPRFMAAGGDRHRLHFLDGMTEDGVKHHFDPATDMDILIDAARRVPDLAAIMVDPVVSAVAGDSHKNAETRRGLQPLVDLARDRRVALIGITHFTKNTQGKDPIERITGSLAFGALARIVLGAAKGEDENAARRLVRIASNIGKSDGGFEYTMHQEPLRAYDMTAQRVVWGKQLAGSARELLENLQGQPGQGLKAIEFLQRMLTEAGDDGASVSDLKKAAEAHSIAWRTLERAKKEMGNVHAKQRPGAAPGSWRWTLCSTTGNGTGSDDGERFRIVH